MALLIRKFAKSKWKVEQLDNNDDIGSDALTSCLRTTGNTLSVWQVETQEEVSKGILAIVSNQDRIETIDIIKLDPAELLEKNIDIEVTDGDSVVESLVKSHRDLSNLTYKKMGIIKDFMIEGIRNNLTQRVNRAQQIELLKDAIKNDLVAPVALKPKVREALGYKNDEKNVQIN